MDESTPAYSYDQARDMLKDVESSYTEAPEVRKFRRDLFKRSTETPQAASKISSRSRVARAETSQRVKVGKAVERAVAKPITTVPGLGAGVERSYADGNESMYVISDEMTPLLAVQGRESGSTHP